jgi:hypothetical protein
MEVFRLHIGTPIYKWPSHIQYQKSVQGIMDHPGFNATYKAVVGDAHIERARAVLLADYLEFCDNGDVPDFFLQLDSDIEFNAEDIYRMCCRNLPVVGGPYAFRSNVDGKRDCVVVRPKPDCPPSDDHLVEVSYLGGGVTMLRADAVDAICAAHPELRMTENPDMHDPQRLTYAVWNPVMVPRPDWPKDKHGRMAQELLSEDYSLCQRLINLGYKIMLDLQVITKHWHGDTPFELTTRKQQEAALQNVIQDSKVNVEHDLAMTHATA